jgi:hypothetical protein
MRPYRRTLRELPTATTALLQPLDVAMLCRRDPTLSGPFSLSFDDSVVVGGSGSEFDFTSVSAFSAHCAATIVIKGHRNHPRIVPPIVRFASKFGFDSVEVTCGSGKKVHLCGPLHRHP